LKNNLIKICEYTDVKSVITIELFLNLKSQDSEVVWLTDQYHKIKVIIGYPEDDVGNWEFIFDNVIHELIEMYCRLNNKVYTYLDNPSEGTTSRLFILSHDDFQEIITRTSSVYCAIEKPLKKILSKIKTQQHKKNVKK
jgi:hypothetical protein